MTKIAEWGEAVKILINEWCHRMIQLGDIELPKEYRNRGFTIFECPELEPFIRTLLAQQREEILDKVETIANECVTEFHGAVDVTGILDEHDFRAKFSALRLSIKKKV